MSSFTTAAVRQVANTPSGFMYMWLVWHYCNATHQVWTNLNSKRLLPSLVFVAARLVTSVPYGVVIIELYRL